jgi:sugar phosphate isomerase/epimerase
MIASLERLCLHTFTTRPWSASECIEHYARAGVRGITWWRETVAGHNLAQLRKHARDAGLTTVGLARGGFFAHADADKRRVALQTNREAIIECAALGAPVLVLVCGADPKQNVQTNLEQIIDGIAALASFAREHGVILAIEPLHPTYAGNRSAIASLACANDVCQRINQPGVAIALDVYHVFWEHDLAAQIQRCAANGWLSAFHMCDYKAEPAHPLFDRGIMGEGVIDIPQIRSWVEATGFAGFHEVEIFSHHWWSQNQHDYLSQIIKSYQQHA